MIDFQGNQIEVGDMVIYYNPGSKSLRVGRVSKINPKSVSILRDGWQTFCSWQCKTLARSPRQIYKV